MLHRIATQPEEEPVTLAQMRAQLGIADAAETARDAIITTRLVSARRWAEQFTRRAFVTQTWNGYADRFDEYFDLIGDVQSVAFVKYYDAAGVLQTLDVSYYQVDTVGNRLLRAADKCWPTTKVMANAVQVQYTSGYGAAAAVPEEIKDAIKFIVGHWETFQAAIEGGVTITRIPYAVEHLLAPCRDYRGGI